MIRVIYDPKFGISLADGQVEKFVTDVVFAHNYCKDTFTESNPLEVISGNCLILDFFRKALVEEKFDKLEVKFEDQIIPVDEYGRLAVWPQGLGDHQRNAVVAILKVRTYCKDVKKTLEEE